MEPNEDFRLIGQFELSGQESYTGTYESPIMRRRIKLPYTMKDAHDKRSDGPFYGIVKGSKLILRDGIVSDEFEKYFELRIGSHNEIYLEKSLYDGLGIRWGDHVTLLGKGDHIEVEISRKPRQKKIAR